MTALQQRKNQKELVGIVVSDKMSKTIVVEVSRRVRHPRYEKVITKYKKFYAHDENEEASLGDKVRIVASRPLSRLKRWRLVEVIERAKAVEKVEV
ncbi:MAG: 30S ribosomal protein S17 [Verrucomicrobiae bacterium]|nr:30S ribosomal protein S17 [Verrucomicrobiae bacterium]